jgi:hypothetical protein
MFKRNRYCSTGKQIHREREREREKERKNTTEAK